MDRKVFIDKGETDHASSDRIKFNPAGFWIRAVAILIDSALIKIFTHLVAFLCITLLPLAGAGLGAIGLSDFVQKQMEASGAATAENKEVAATILAGFAGLGAGALIAFLIIIVVSLGVFFLYPAIFESSRMHGTIGKYLLGLKVGGEGGYRISFGRALVRNMAKILSAIPFGGGFLLAGLTVNKQALHDKIAGTYVIKARQVSYGRIFILIIFSVAIIAWNPFPKTSFSKPKVKVVPQEELIRGAPPRKESLFSKTFPSSGSEDLVRYIDENGSVNFVTGIENVPERYRFNAVVNPKMREVGKYSSWSKPPKKTE